MHPTLLQEVARYREADLLREAARVERAHSASMAADRQPRRFSLFRFGVGRLRAARPAPLLGR